MQHHKDTELQTWLRAGLIVLSLGIGGCVDENDSLMDELGEADEFRGFSWEPLEPTADAMVKENQPSTNFGGANLAMRTNSSANAVSFLQFDLSAYGGLDGIAQLKLHVCANTSNFVAAPAIYRFRVMTVGDKLTTGYDWSEYTIKWKNKPTNVAVAAADRSFSTLSPCDDIELDLDNLASVLVNDNILSLKLERGPTITNPTNITVFSSEHGTADQQPKLMVWPID